MKTLAWVLIIISFIGVAIPLSDSSDDGALNFSQIKRSIEGLEPYQDAFLEDMTKLSFMSEVLTKGVIDGLKVEIVTPSQFEYESLLLGRNNFYTDDGVIVFKLRVYDDQLFGGYIDYDYPTPINYVPDSEENYNQYMDYVNRHTRIAERFLNAYNKYIEANAITEILYMVEMIGTSIVLILYVLLIFLFDSISMVWGLLVLVLRILGVMPIPIT